MARNTTISLPSGEWTEVTNANATAVRVQNLSGFAIHLSATSGAVEPGSLDGSLLLDGRQTMATDLTLAQLWPGVSGANRLWAWASTPVTVSVSHA